MDQEEPQGQQPIAAPRVAPRPYLRSPAIAPGGDTILFVYAGDIWLAGASGGEAERLTSHYAGHTHPRWSPDGERFAFTSGRSGQGDIYVLPLRGGEVRRVTYHEAAANVECWSADGSAIFFTSERERQGAAVFRVGAEGGTPVRWLEQPHEQLADVAASPDGELLALALVRDRWWRLGPNPYGGAELWVCSSEPLPGAARPLAHAPGLTRWPMWAPGGRALYAVSDRGGAANLWHFPLEGEPRQVTRFESGRVLWPSISADGHAIVFERDFGIWRLDTRTGECGPIDVRVRSDQKFTPARVVSYSRELSELALAPDGKKVAIVARGEVFADFADKETDKDLRQGPAIQVTRTAAREGDVSWSPDSRRLAYISDRDGEPEVYRYDFAARAEQRLTAAPKVKSAPAHSPDGRWIAYVAGDDEIRLIDAASGEDRPFVRALLGYGAAPAWSPDSAWLVFSALDDHHIENLYVQRVGEERARQITTLGNLTTTGPIWAPSGQFIIFTTGQYRAEMQVARVDLRPPAPVLREAEFERLFGREEPAKAGAAAPPPEKAEGEPAPPAEGAEAPKAEEKPAEEKPGLEIVFEGLDRRVRLLTPVQIDAAALCISPDSRDLIFRATVMGKPNLWSMALDEPRAEQPARQLTATAGQKWAAQFSPDGKLLYYLDGGQVVLRKMPGGEQTYPQYSAEVQVDFHQEKWQLFGECWRLLRDQFYDPAFNGADWGAVRERYAPLVAGAQTSGDLFALLNLMMGELRASHLGFGYRSARPSDDGHLGVLLDSREQAEAGRLVVAGVVPDSPAALAGLVAGVELRAVNGQPLGPGESLDRLLSRTARRRARLLVAGPGEQPEREVTLRPVDSGAYEQLRYRAWVQSCEAIVHAASGGRVGYVHIPEMSYEAYQQFLADLDAEAYGKQGIIVDVRHNGGGHTAAFFVDVLTRRSTLLSDFRGRTRADAGHLAGSKVLSRPTALLTNEHTASNAEMFTETYRRLGIGPVVGRPTAGAVVWTWRPRLIDGATVGLPRMRVTTLDGEDLEGRGRPVDVDVALPLGEPERGRDSQLEAAVRVLLERIATDQVTG